MIAWMQRLIVRRGIHGKSVWRKRLASAYIALTMPREGVDENLETACEELVYWQEMKELPPYKPPEPVVFTAKITGVRWEERPLLYIED